MGDRSIELDNKVRKSSFKSLGIRESNKKEFMRIMNDIYVYVDIVNKMRIRSLRSNKVTDVKTNIRDLV